MMLRFPLLRLVPLALVAACAPLDTFYKAGVPVETQARDTTACRVEALRQVPPDVRTRHIPAVYSTRQVCDANGNCWLNRILISPASFEQYDANLGLRETVTRQCMARQGYEKRSIPRCDAATTRATPPAPTRVLPPLSSESCSIRLPSGDWQIVTPPG